MKMLFILIAMITLKTNFTQALGPLVAKLQDSRLYDTAIRTAATSVLGEMKTRIHEQGKAADGSDIGTYSKKPIYVSITANPGKSFGRPIGKSGKSKFASGKKKGQDHKSRYFPQGYSEYKTAIGRNQLGKVNLSLSGQLNSQLALIATSRGYGLGWPDDEKLKRSAFLEKKYGKKIWALAGKEKEIALAAAENVIKRALLE